MAWPLVSSMGIDRQDLKPMPRQAVRQGCAHSVSASISLQVVIRLV